MNLDRNIYPRTILLLQKEEQILNTAAATVTNIADLDTANFQLTYSQAFSLVATQEYIVNICLICNFF